MRYLCRASGKSVPLYPGCGAGWWRFSPTVLCSTGSSSCLQHAGTWTPPAYYSTLLNRFTHSVYRTECQAFSPVVRIGFPSPLSSEGEFCPCPLWGGGGHTRLQERGRWEPIRTRGKTLWCSRYNPFTVLPMTEPRTSKSLDHSLAQGDSQKMN